MSALAVHLTQLARGWSVALTDGRELARFTGPAAKWRAERYATAISRPSASSSSSRKLRAPRCRLPALER